MVLNYAGAEIGEAGEAQAIIGSFVGSTTQKRTGAYSWKVTGNGTQQHYGIFKKHSTITGAFSGFNVATNYVFFGFYVDTLPASGSECMFEFLAVMGRKGMLQITSAGEIDLYKPLGGGIAKIEDGTTQLQTGQWYTIELTVGTGFSSAYELRINSVTEYSGTENFGNLNHDSLRLGFSSRQGATSPVFYYDDLVIQDDAFPGDSYVSMLTVDGQGVHTGWLYDYQHVDEIPMNMDGDFIAARLAARKESVTCISCDSANVAAGAQLVAVKGNWYTRNAALANGASLQYFLRHNSTETGTTGEDIVTADYLFRAYVLERAWTRAEVDGLETVVKLYIATGNYARCTMTNACVLWKPAAAAIRRPRYTPHAGI